MFPGQRENTTRLRTWRFTGDLEGSVLLWWTVSLVRGITRGSSGGMGTPAAGATDGDG